MPNYSHGTKLALAAADEPPYLTVGTDVSAKYKGAFCEAKIIDVNKNVKVRVLFDGSSGNHLIDDTELKAGSTLEVGAKVEAKRPEKKQQTYIAATITKILDHSRYTVVFDDGDQCILRRSSICLKSGKHFAESETLDQLPLTNPEHFGNPVKVGQATAEQSSNQQNNNHNHNHNNNNINSSRNNQQAQNDKQSSSNLKIDSNHTVGGRGNSKIVNSDSNSTSTNGRAAATQNNVKLETTDKPTSKTKTASSNSITASAALSTPGRRGVKGRRAKDSTVNNSKLTDMADDPGDSSQDSTEADNGDPSVNELIEVGVKLMVQYGKGKIQNVYEAKVNKIETNSAGKTRYFVHYTGWNNRYDEWVTKNRILSIVTDKENGVRDGRSRHSETANTTASSTAASSNSTAKEYNSVKEKDVPIPADSSKKLSGVTVKASTGAAATAGKASATPKAAVHVGQPTKSASATETAKKSETTTKKTVSKIDSTSSNNTVASNANTLKPKAAKVKVEVKNASSDAANNADSKNVTTTASHQDAPQTKSESHTKVASPTSKSAPKVAKSTTDKAAAAVVLANTATTVSETVTSSDEEVSEENEASRKKKATVLVNQPPASNPTSKPVVKVVAPKAAAKSSSASAEKHDNESSTKTTTETHHEEMDSSKKEQTISSKPTATVVTVTTKTMVAPKASTAAAASATKCEHESSNPTTTTTSTKKTTSDDKKANSHSASTSKLAVVKATVVTSKAPAAKAASANNPDESSKHTASNKTTSVHVKDEPNISITFSNNVMSAYNLIEKERFSDLPIIDEPDCDKRISILQDKIMAIKQTYLALRSELADLDRRKKRPRLERSNSDHINFSGVTCRN